MKNKWIMTLDDEKWESNNYDVFDTEQELLEYIISTSGKELVEMWEEEYGVEVVEENDEVVTIYYGQEQDYIPSVNAERVLEDISENAYSEVGDYSESYLYDIPSEELEELEQSLNEVLEKWIKKYKHEPDFYTIQNEKCITKKLQGGESNGKVSNFR